VKFLELSSERFDLVIMRHVLEHFKKEEILHLLNLVLLHIKDKGKFIVEVPNCSSPLFGAYNQSADFTHEVGFTGESLREILKTAGFHNVHVGPYKVKPKAKRLIFSMLNNIMKIISNKEIYFDSAIFAIAEKSF
jgi:2-polyprenyl-3-methyl-5-hydroxy-6-metoxy-1,4-benzoquinol methylase